VIPDTEAAPHVGQHVTVEGKFGTPMPITVELPKFDESNQVTLTDWMKSIGDQVEVGDVIVGLKIDGSARYLEAFDYGTLSKVLVSEGEKVRSG
jgi:pyruvate/2-oxoglutarate dehydrogenase complex dihydrolipoamide acyltransferase (E2) component